MMNMDTPPTLLRPPSKARKSSVSSSSIGHYHFCPTVTTSTSKLFRIILSIGAVGLLLINTQNHGFYDHPINDLSLQGSSALKSQDDNDNGEEMTATMDRQLRTPKQTVAVEEAQLDFAVVGFEKTGTTFLLEVFGNHPEIIMPVKHSSDSDNICVRKKEGKETLKRWILQQQREHEQHQLLSNATTSKRMKFGVKCSEMIRKPLGIENWADISNANLIVGVRHPVEWFQSNYNYRVMLHRKDKKSTSNIPSPHTLTNHQNLWHGVSTTSAQYDKYLQQLGKTSLNHEELSNLLQTLSSTSGNIRINHNPLRVFIYTIEQLEDTNTTRRTNFETDLQHFLKLETPFTEFTSQAKSNVNKVSYPEYIDICQSEFDSIRNVLVREGKKSSEWILNRFIMSEDVVVSNVEYFKEKLRLWGEDPCSVEREE